MTEFITYDRIMTELCPTKCAKGNWFQNIAPLGEDVNWIEVPAPSCPGDPNDAEYDNKIFGYDEKAFLRRQYK